MKNTYAAPVATTRGDVVRSTLSGKAMGDELSNPFVRPSGGSALGFGL